MPAFSKRKQLLVTHRDVLCVENSVLLDEKARSTAWTGTKLLFLSGRAGISSAIMTLSVTYSHLCIYGGNATKATTPTSSTTRVSKLTRLMNVVNVREERKMRACVYFLHYHTMIRERGCGGGGGHNTAYQNSPTTPTAITSVCVPGCVDLAKRCDPSHCVTN